RAPHAAEPLDDEVDVEGEIARPVPRLGIRRMELEAPDGAVVPGDVLEVRVGAGRGHSAPTLPPVPGAAGPRLSPRGRPARSGRDPPSPSEPAPRPRRPTSGGPGADRADPAVRRPAS